MNNDPEFVKKGVVAGETEDAPVKTASDEIQDKVRCCSPTNCCCRAKKGATNEDRQ